jgi:hypothetical protein
MSAYHSLSEAIQGYIDLTRQEQAACAVLPPPTLPQAEERLSSALKKIPSASAARCTTVVNGDSQKPALIKYYIFQHSIGDLRLRVDRYTAQRARLLSKEVEGDRTELLTLADGQELTFDELLRQAVGDAYGVTSAYASRLPFRACLLNEGVDVQQVRESELASTTFAKGAYLRRIPDAAYEGSGSLYLGIGKIYLALTEGASGSDIADESKFEEQPEYVETRGRATFLIAEQGDGARWDLQTLERIHEALGSYLFYAILAGWYMLCADEAAMQLNAGSASSALTDVAIALDAGRLAKDIKSMEW